LAVRKRALYLITQTKLFFMEQDQPTSLFEMQADSLTQSRLNSISKWGKFISISVLIMVTLCTLVFFVARDEIMAAVTKVIDLDNSLAGALIAIVALFAALFVAWFFFLLRASTLIKQGLLANNSDKLAEGFKAMRIFFGLSIVISILSILGTLSGMINS
jgi:hypothetical protein